MSGLSTIPENGKIVGGIEEPKPGSGSTIFNVKVCHGNKQHEVSVRANSTFGDLKSVITQTIGLKPETYKLLFRGKEKEDDEDLETVGVKNNSKVVLLEDMTCRQLCPGDVNETSVTSRGGEAVAAVREEVNMLSEQVSAFQGVVDSESQGHDMQDMTCPGEVNETSVISRGGEAVAAVREEVDMLSEQASALQIVVDSGSQVNEKDIVYLSEMLMRQLLKLDAIEAEGEGRVQRKIEVRRIQSFMDTIDILKSRNSNLLGDANNVSPTTQRETFELGCESLNAASPMPQQFD